MMKRLKRLFVLCLAFAMIITLYTPAKAAESEWTSVSWTLANKGKETYCWWTNYTENQSHGCYVQINSQMNSKGYLVVDDFPKPIKNLKSTNTKVLYAYTKKTGDDSYSLYMKLKKAGTAKLSYSYGDINIKLKNTITTYTSPVKTLKVGSKSYASKVKSTPKGVITGTPKGKVYVKTNKNWTIKKMILCKQNMGGQDEEGTTLYGFTGKTKATSKKSLTIKSGYVLQVTCYNSKTKQYSCVYLGSKSTLKKFNDIEIY